MIVTRRSMISAFSCATLARASIHIGMPAAASANAFLEIARRTTIGDEADIDAAGMRTVQRRKDAGPARASRCMARSTSTNFDWRSSARRYRYVTSFWEFSIEISYIEISQKLAHLGGERVGVDKDFVPGRIDGADGEPGAILIRRKAGDDGCGERDGNKRDGQHMIAEPGTGFVNMPSLNAGRVSGKRRWCDTGAGGV